MIALIIVPACVFCFFLGFYSQLIIKILVDMLNTLTKINFHGEVKQQQEQLDRQITGTTFVEPQTQAEIEAQEELDKIERLNDLSRLPPED